MRSKEHGCGRWMIECQDQNQWEGLNQNQRQSQEKGCLMVEGENLGLVLS